MTAITPSCYFIHELPTAPPTAQVQQYNAECGVPVSNAIVAVNNRILGVIYSRAHQVDLKPIDQACTFSCVCRGDQVFFVGDGPINASLLSACSIHSNMIDISLPFSHRNPSNFSVLPGQCKMRHTKLLYSAPLRIRLGRSRP